MERGRSCAPVDTERAIDLVSGAIGPYMASIIDVTTMRTQELIEIRTG
jgi:hypothetical protein